MNSNRIKKLSEFLLLGLLAFSLQLCNEVPSELGGESESDDVVVNLVGAQRLTRTAPVFEVNDPLFPSQWHLKNDGNFQDGIRGVDANVLPAWNKGYTGKGVNVLVVDDGVDLTHEDLNINRTLSRELSGRMGNNQLRSTSGDCRETQACHGTAVSGMVGMKINNGIGGAGPAPEASIGSRNYLSFQTVATITESLEDTEGVDISNNSWGPASAAGRFVQSWNDRLIKTGLKEGRNGKGTIFVFAAGNGQRYGSNFRFGGYPREATSYNKGLIPMDSPNYVAYKKIPEVFSICAIGNRGEQVYYSNRGANLLVCGYSQGNNFVASTTADVMGGIGYNPNTTRIPFNQSFNNNYTNTFNGTSSAAPNVSGVIALVLEANSNLSWRDVRWILAKSARKVHPEQEGSSWIFYDKGWQTNAAGFNINHNYGFGAVDAGAAVDLAERHTPFADEVNGENGCESTRGVDLRYPTITDENNIDTFGTSTATLSGCAIQKIESVEVTVRGNIFSNFGDLDIRIVSPSGTESIINEPRPCFTGRTNSSSDILTEARCNPRGETFTWTFTTLRNMDEDPNGTWTLKAVDRVNSNFLNPGVYRDPRGNRIVVNEPEANIHTEPAGRLTRILDWSVKVRGRAN